ncbi:hypothetical protein PIB30_003680 [Stylosanthes scabra]|uniref:Uncharacterized protein n=1 Tax=Stylosanthes scabra TaxID=79078 RepID=A0ABU6Z379_9FABA|nr:hypothetical protein [Stylosanthes scabra]
MDTTLTSPPLQAKVDALADQLFVAQGERLSALAQLSEVEEDSKVRATELQSCRASLGQEQKKVEALTHSLEEMQSALDMAEANVVHWFGSWKALAAETGEIGKRIYVPSKEAGGTSEPLVQPKPSVELQSLEVQVEGPHLEGAGPEGRAPDDGGDTPLDLV